VLVAHPQSDQANSDTADELTGMGDIELLKLE
jgi:hypothetical protein